MCSLAVHCYAAVLFLSQQCSSRFRDEASRSETNQQLACAIWSEDADFFGTGIAVWTTSRIEIFLLAQAKVPESEEG